MTVAKAVGSARGASDTGGAVTTTSPRRSSALAAEAAASTRSAVTMPDRNRIPSPFPAEGDVAGLDRTGLLARGSSSPGPFPPCGSGATGFVPPHSCGAAGDSHPLPASDEVGRVYLPSGLAPSSLLANGGAIWIWSVPRAAGVRPVRDRRSPAGARAGPPRRLPAPGGARARGGHPHVRAGDAPRLPLRPDGARARHVDRAGRPARGGVTPRRGESLASTRARTRGRRADDGDIGARPLPRRGVAA